MLGERLMCGESVEGPWNFGPDEEWSVERVVDKVIAIYGSGSWVLAPNSCPENPVLKVDATKAKTQLGWHPMWDTEQAIERTMGWYANPDHEHAYLTDIVAYEEAVNRLGREAKV